MTIYDKRFKNYTKTAVQPMRPYEEGEDMTNINVDEMITPEKGGMIAIDPNNLVDRWYVSKEYFNSNYIEVSD